MSCYTFQESTSNDARHITGITSEYPVLIYAYVPVTPRIMLLTICYSCSVMKKQPDTYSMP